MKFDNQYKFFKLEHATIQLTKSFSTFHHFIPVYQLACLIVLLLLTIPSQIYGSIDFVFHFIENLKVSLFSANFANRYALIGNIISILMISFGLVRLRLITNYDEMSPHPTLQKVLLWLALGSFYTTQIFIYLVGWAFAKIYHEQGFAYAFLKGSLPLLYYIYTNFRYETASLFGWQTVPIILLVTQPSIPTNYFVLILQMIYLLFVRKGLIKKICIGISVFLVLFVFVNQSELFEYYGTSNQQAFISFTLLGIILLIISVIIIKCQSFFMIKNPLDIAARIFQTVKNVKSDVPFASLDYQQYYELYSNLFGIVYNNKDISSTQVQCILEKYPENLTKHEYLFLLEKCLEKESKISDSNHIITLIILVRVRMQLNYSLHSVIEDVFVIREEIQKSKSDQMYQYMELFDQVMAKYALFKDKQTETSYILYTNRLHENLEDKITEFLCSVSAYWKLMTSKSLQVAEIHNAFQKIYQQKDEIDVIYSQIAKFHCFKKEKTIISIIQYLLNPYKSPKQSITEITSSSQQKLEHESSTFLILEDQSIKFLSQDFLKSIDKGRNLAFQNVHKTDVFGQELVTILDQLTQNITVQSQTQWFTVPIICRKNCVKLKKINILWTPSLEVRNKFMIRFSDDPLLSEGCFVIYECKTDTIKYFNEQFIKIFHIEQTKFVFQLKNSKIFFNELFTMTQIQLEQVKDYLRQGATMKCNIYLKNYIQKGFIQVVPVEITVTNCITVNQQLSYCTMRIDSIGHQKLCSTLSETRTTSANEFMHEDNLVALNQESLMKQYKDQQFFCKLPNLYEAKITQKQSELQQQGRLTYIKFMNLLFLLLIILLITFWNLQSKFLQERIEQYQQGLKSIENTSQQYALVFQLYSIAIKRYYIQQFPSQILMTYKLPDFFMDQILVDAQRTFLSQFLARYLVQLKNPPNKPINYTLDFKTFSIHTSSLETTMMDFAQDFQQNIANLKIQFLLKNYNNFRKITVDYENSFNTIEKLNDIGNQYQIQLKYFLGVTVFLLVVMALLLCKIQSTIDLVYSLIQRIENKEIREHLNVFDQCKKSIFDVLNQSYSSYSKNQSKISHLHSWTTLSQTTSASFNPLEQEREITKKKLKINRQPSENIMNQSFGQSEFNDSQSQNTLSLKKKVQKLMPKGKHMIPIPFIKKLAKRLPFVFLIFVLIAIFLIDRSQLIYERDGMIQLYEIKKNLYISLLHVKRQSVDSPIVPTLKHFYNDSSIDDPYSIENVSLVGSLPSKIILKEMADFNTKVFDAFESNMCKFIGPYGGMAVKPCQTYLKGFVSKGFKASFNLYIKNSRILANQSIQDFGPYPCTQEKCSPYYQHELVSILMGQTSRYLVNLLNKSTESAFCQMTQHNNFRIIVKMIGIIFGCILYTLYSKDMGCKCRTALQFFTMVPKNIMCSLKMTIYFRKNNFLDKLDIL